MPHKDPEVRRLYNIEYRRKNIVRKRENNRKWDKENPEKKKKSAHKYNIKNREKKRILMMAWQKKNPDKKLKQNRKTYLWAFYRITLEDKVKIEEFEKLNSPILLGQRNGVDHRHDTGQVYGVLDWRINRALGLIEKVSKENASKILRVLADYLDNPPAVQALGRKVYGLVGVGKYKKKMIYGSENGPLPPDEKELSRRSKKKKKGTRADKAN